MEQEAMSRKKQQHMEIPFEIDKVGEYYLASCPNFEVATQGETIEEAKRSLCTALELIIDAAVRKGTLSYEIHECEIRNKKLKLAKTKKNQKTISRFYYHHPLSQPCSPNVYIKTC